MALWLKDAGLNDKIKVKGADRFKRALSPVIGGRFGIFGCHLETFVGAGDQITIFSVFT